MTTEQRKKKKKKEKKKKKIKERKLSSNKSTLSLHSERNVKTTASKYEAQLEKNMKRT
jgi:hypothetical protein